MHGNRKEYIINKKEVLNKMYHLDGLSQRQIAIKIGCSIYTIQRRMKEFGIKGREWTTKDMNFPGHITLEMRKKLIEGRKNCYFVKNGGHWKGKKRGPTNKETKIKMSKSHKKRVLLGLHNNYKGGVTSENRLQRVRFRKSIQKRVFERDNYTCQICGERGIELQVDHIQSWAEYVELRFCIDNCRTLCVKCHYKITFGKPMPPSIKAWGHNLLKSQTQL